MMYDEGMQSPITEMLLEDREGAPLAEDAPDAALLQQYTADIKRLVGRTAHNVVLIGQKLQLVKDHLEHGAWLAWLEREFAWSDRTARRMIEVAHRFTLDTVANLPIETGALYLLAAPKTPEPAVTEALTLAQQGETITQVRAQGLINKYRPVRTGAPSTEKDKAVPVMPGTMEAPQAPAATPARDASQWEADATALGDLEGRAPVQGTSALETHASPSPGAPVTRAGAPAPAGPAQVQWVPRVLSLLQHCQPSVTVDTLSELVAYVATDQLDALQEALDQVMHTLLHLTRLVQARRQQATPGSPPAPVGEPAVPLPADASPEVIHAAIVAVLPT